MKNYMPQSSFQEDVQKLPYNTGQYLVSWLHLCARKTGEFCLYSEWLCAWLKILLLQKKEQLLGDSCQSATPATSALSSILAHFISFLGLALPLRTLTRSVSTSANCVSNPQIIQVHLDYSYTGATCLPLVSVTLLPVIMSFLRRDALFLPKYGKLVAVPRR